MSIDMGHLECRICGRSIYFPLAEGVMKNGERLIELTCSRGHSDSYWDTHAERMEEVTPQAEMARATVVGF